MSFELGAFDASIERCRALVVSAEYLRQHVPALGETADDILRASLAHAVSALDRFVHERVRTCMLEAAQGTRSRTSAFNRFPVPLASALDSSRTGPAPVDAWLSPAIVEQHGILSFQRAEKIADAFRLVVAFDSGLWPAVAATLGEPDVRDLKERLDLIVDRRNQIVHEDDAETASRRAAIDSVMVTDAIDFLAGVVSAIDALVDP
jgi:hypothetical protein